MSSGKTWRSNTARPGDTLSGSPALVAELLKLPATVIAATGGEASARAAKSATSQIPIVFTAGSDPVNAGLVGIARDRPGGNVTGASVAGSELDAKRLQLLHEFVPKAAIHRGPNRSQ